jgi:hypothetical protein
MNNRPSLYRDIHKGIRVMIFDLVQKAGRTDFNEERELSILRNETRSIFELLSGHAEHENTFIGPVVEAKAPELIHLVGAAHDDQEKTLAELEELLLSIDPASQSAVSVGHSFVVRLSRFFGDVMVHMSDEEDQIMPALWKTMTDGELMEVHDRLVAAIAPDKMARYLTWMLPSMTRADRAEMLAGMKAHAPAEVFGFVRGLAKSVLSAEEDAALEKALTTAHAAA